ncbi:MAG TPA: anthranilate synthase component I [Phycisphaerae bacterium]|nr:anthranilate synthase component I [Phycisphaerales bacterium]HRX83671.1 anthranilate synthase component I [Phycisphaerae bacterium]
MLELHPTRERFDQLARRAGAVPVYCQLLSDQLTPVSAFAKLAQGAEHAFLLESVVGGEKIARFSFLAANPAAVFEANGSEATFRSADGAESWDSGDPLARLEEILKGYSVAHLPELPRFIGGAVGYAGYDVIRYYERLPNAPEDDRRLPDLYFGLYDEMVIFDHVQKRINVVALARVDRDGADAAYADARRRIERIVADLSQVAPAPLLAIAAPQESLPYKSNFVQADFERAVDRCKEYIRAGDIFQVVISQRLAVDTTAHPFDIYRALRAVNPSPFMFYLKAPKTTLVGASPEILCRVEDGVVTTRPLAGTRPRGRNPDEDAALEKELLSDPKECAEHVMLVDLGRNDVGRVAELSTVKVDELMTVERYSHVMHISSNVTGTLAEGRSAFDALRAVLPVGTVSGAPKIRAMEIIDELEPTRRGPYAGAVGYFDFAGNMDTCIALRTLVVTESPDGSRKVYAQVGAGIVADSEPSREYAETLHKAASMLKAIDVAQVWTTQASSDKA